MGRIRFLYKFVLCVSILLFSNITESYSQHYHSLSDIHGHVQGMKVHEHLHITPLLLNDDLHKDLRTQSFFKPVQILSDQTSIKTNVGSIESFYVRNILDLSKWYLIEAECVKIDQKVAVWINTDDLVWLKDSLDVENAIEGLSKLLTKETSHTSINPNTGILDIVRSYFGEPPNINGSGLVDILLLDIPDFFEDTGNFVSGFFDPVNLFDHAFSNKRDMLYIDLYPTLFYNGIVSIDRAASTIAHEYQHLIHANYEIESLQYTFVNEGLSELAEIITGFSPRESSSYFSDISRELLSWDYENPIPDYSRASLFFPLLI